MFLFGYLVFEHPLKGLLGHSLSEARKPGSDSPAERESTSLDNLKGLLKCLNTSYLVIQFLNGRFDQNYH